MSGSSKSSSKALKKWWGKLRFEDNRNFIGNGDYRRYEYFFDDKDVIEEMDEYIDGNDKIIGLQYYTSSGIHGFTLIETEKWYWSLEKHEMGISLQRSKERKAVVNFFAVDKRRMLTNPFSTRSLFRDDYSVYNVIRWLYKSNELCKGYDLVADNCRDFARRLIHRFCSSGEDTRFDLLVVVIGAGHVDGILAAPVRLIKRLLD